MPPLAVLVVEDDPDIREVISAVLQVEGYAVSAASNGAEALARLEDAPVDLLLTDLMMPVMDGWSLVRAAKLRPDLARMRVLVITAQHDAVVDGIDRLLLKPFELHVLVDEVAALLSRIVER